MTGKVCYGNFCDKRIDKKVARKWGGIKRHNALMEAENQIYNSDDLPKTEEGYIDWPKVEREAVNLYRKYYTVA
jgi:hypothetical protein